LNTTNYADPAYRTGLPVQSLNQAIVRINNLPNITDTLIFAKESDLLLDYLAESIVKSAEFTHLKGIIYSERRKRNVVDIPYGR